MSYLTLLGPNIQVLRPNIGVLGPNIDRKSLYLAKFDEKFWSKANWQHKYIFWKCLGQVGSNMSYSTWRGLNIHVLWPNIWVRGANIDQKCKYVVNIYQQFGSKANWQSIWKFILERSRSNMIKYIWRGPSQIFETWGQIFESWSKILDEKANMWQKLTSNLEVRQIDNQYEFVLEMSRWNMIKYVIFNVAGPK